MAFDGLPVEIDILLQDIVSERVDGVIGADRHSNKNHRIILVLIIPLGGAELVRI